MFDVKLINSVRDFPELYDLGHSKYNDIGSKDQTWTQIGEELNETGLKCKKRWNNIRDNFRKSMKRGATKSGPAAKFIGKYKFEKQLNFLLPFILERETKSNLTSPEYDFEKISKVEIQSEEIDEKIYKVEIESEEIDENICKVEIPSEEIDEKICKVDIDEIDTHEYTGKRPISSTHLTSKKRVCNSQARRRVSQETASAKLLNYLDLIQNKFEESEKKSVDPVDAFLAGIGSTLRTFPPYQLHLAKTKIFTAVQEVEMGLISCHQNTTPAQPPLYQISSSTPTEASVSSTPEVSGMQSNNQLNGVPK